jgi:hypothetical protein
MLRRHIRPAPVSPQHCSPISEAGNCKKRIMYIERKAGSLDGPGRIGWVGLSRTTRSYVYAGKRFLKIKSGYKYNRIEKETGQEYWISGCKKDGSDKLSGGIVDIDEDARAEYWTKIRNRPDCVNLKQCR